MEIKRERNNPSLKIPKLGGGYKEANKKPSKKRLSNQ